MDGGPIHSAADELLNLIEHAAHYLPAQGPITAFVHHNTLHAFEDCPFEEGVVEGAELFGCHPFLPEARYRAKLDRGRIDAGDIEAVLREDLGEDANACAGPAGTRLELRLGMLAHPHQTGPTAELKWLIEDTAALRGCRSATPAPKRDQGISETRHWVMRDLRGASLAEENVKVAEMLRDLFQRFDGKTLDSWTETTWEEFWLHLLWLICQNGVREVNGSVPKLSGHLPPQRHVDLLHEVSGVDCGGWVDEVLIRFSAAFLDQDFAPSPLPHREKGFLDAFANLYGTDSALADRWLREAGAELKATTCALDSIAASLTELGVGVAEREDYLIHTLLALRGFAGMLWQTECRGDRVAKATPKGTLVEYLAVRLILERAALRQAAQDGLEYHGSLAGLRGAARQRFVPHPVSSEQRSFEVFQLAQVLGWTPEKLYQQSATEWAALIREIESFSGQERRRIYHLAFERHYRRETLDAVAHHSRRVRETDDITTPAERPSFQVVTCIDEREESFRRALEEIAPDCETLGAAGFFAVAMNYKGAADAHYTPLCPVIIEPKHYVAEKVVYTRKRDEKLRQKRRRTIGTVTHQVHLGSRTFAGGALAGIFGSIASIPLVARILFPRLTAKLRTLMGGFVRTPAVTELELSRTEEEPGKEVGHIGYSVTEMADVVERLLGDMGLTKNLSRLVIICGHGSSSLNNPHEAAHDCGACGGGRGGPNARAFAQMANNPGVRGITAQRGLEIPKDTVFLGAYHNTCDDSVTCYDLERLPTSHSGDYEVACIAIDEARKRSAHERCRRFESAPLDLDFEDALRHVEGRAEDLSQVRPEYGHATNALCFVGRREWSRGLYLDRRAFLQSYDPAQDDEECTILTRVLSAVIPVCGGINLEYYFSYVDPVGYGCGTKLPHNITSLLGVMNGAASDLRPGLPWQMVEIHEPVRLLFVIETTPEKITRILDRNPGLATLVRGCWVQLATVDPIASRIDLYHDGEFVHYQPGTSSLPSVHHSQDWYRGWREHLGFVSIVKQGVEVSR
jgi:uncharacterized protein